MKAKKVLEKIMDFLDEKDKVREQLVRQTRDVIRGSKNAIKEMYVRNFPKAEEYLQETRRNYLAIVNLAKKFPDLYYGGIVSNAAIEYVEAEIVYSLLTRGDDIPAPEDLSATPIVFLLGLADALSELRRFILEDLRKGELDEAENLLHLMESLYLELSSLQYPEGLIPGFRRKCDMLRRLIDETKSDILFVKYRLK